MKTPEEREAVTAAMIGFDAAAVASETKWGVGRLITLVSDATRLSYHRGWEMWHQAQLDRDARAMLEVIPKMIRALKFMDAEAERLGAQPLAPTVWETRTEDGRVLAIVRTQAEAHAVAHANRAMVVYSLDEVARLLRRVEMIDAIKLEFPGARVSKVTRFEEGFGASWATAEPLHEALFGEPEPLAKPPRKMPLERPYKVDAA